MTCLKVNLVVAALLSLLSIVSGYQSNEANHNKPGAFVAPSGLQQLKIPAPVTLAPQFIAPQFGPSLIQQSPVKHRKRLGRRWRRSQRRKQAMNGQQQQQQQQQHAQINQSQNGSIEQIRAKLNEAQARITEAFKMLDNIEQTQLPCPAGAQIDQSSSKNPYEDHLNGDDNYEDEGEHDDQQTTVQQPSIGQHRADPIGSTSNQTPGFAQDSVGTYNQQIVTSPVYAGQSGTDLSNRNEHQSSRVNNQNQADQPATPYTIPQKNIQPTADPNPYQSATQTQSGSGGHSIGPQTAAPQLPVGGDVLSSNVSQMVKQTPEFSGSQAKESPKSIQEQAPNLNQNPYSKGSPQTGDGSHPGSAPNQYASGMFEPRQASNAAAHPSEGSGPSAATNVNPYTQTTSSAANSTVGNSSAQMNSSQLPQSSQEKLEQLAKENHNIGSSPGGQSTMGQHNGQNNGSNNPYIKSDTSSQPTAGQDMKSAVSSSPISKSRQDDVISASNSRQAMQSQLPDRLGNRQRDQSSGHEQVRNEPVQGEPNSANPLNVQTNDSSMSDTTAEHRASNVAPPESNTSPSNQRQDVDNDEDEDYDIAHLYSDDEIEDPPRPAMKDHSQGSNQGNQRQSSQLDSSSSSSPKSNSPDYPTNLRSFAVPSDNNYQRNPLALQQSTPPKQNLQPPRSAASNGPSDDDDDDVGDEDDLEQLYSPDEIDGQRQSQQRPGLYPHQAAQGGLRTFSLPGYVANNNNNNNNHQQIAPLEPLAPLRPTVQAFDNNDDADYEDDDGDEYQEPESGNRKRKRGGRLKGFFGRGVKQLKRLGTKVKNSNYIIHDAVEKTKFHAAPHVMSMVDQTRHAAQAVQSRLFRRHHRRHEHHSVEAQLPPPRQNQEANSLTLSRTIPDRLGQYPAVPPLNSGHRGGTNNIEQQQHQQQLRHFDTGKVRTGPSQEYRSMGSDLQSRSRSADGQKVSVMRRSSSFDYSTSSSST